MIVDSEGKTVKEVKEYIGKVTNNTAEYMAIIKALQVASQLGGKNISLFSDSELIVNQLNGNYKVKDEKLRELCREAKALERNFERVDIESIRRENNKQADKLANVAINLGTL